MIDTHDLAPLWRRFWRGVAAAGAIGALIAGGAAAAAATPPAGPAILPLRARAAIVDQWLKLRLDTVLPAIMRERGVDMWVLVSRENFEEPVIASMLDAESMHARRLTILVAYDPGAGKPIERLTISRYGLGGLFEPAWDPARQPDQWARLAEVIAARQPRRIAINSSPKTVYADGMTLSGYEQMIAALPPALRDRVVRDDRLAVRWLETRTPAEMARYHEIAGVAHAILAEGLSDRVVRPGVTTADDLVWWYREKIAAMKLETWFHPSVAISRRGVAQPIEGATVIEKGDLIWTDFGITYLRLNTDMQENAYVLRDGETAAPKGLRDGLVAANRVQDALTASFRLGDTGNAVLARARAAAMAQGLNPSIYSHPIGFHGHGAGTAIGFWDNQGADPRGDYPIFADTAWSIELSATMPVPEWGNQPVPFRLEEDAFFDGSTVRYIDGRQTDLFLIGGKRASTR